MSELTDPIILNPTGPTVASVVWLHGLGADGNDFVPVAEQLGLLQRGVRFVFPHAPVRPITVNGGMAMRAWYDLFGIEFDGRQDESGIRASAAAVAALLENEIAAGIEPSRLILAGFSQGGAIALHAGLRLQPAIGGIIALSTYLPLAASLAAVARAEPAELPIFMAHGRFDPLIPIELARASRVQIEQQGRPVEWHDYAVEHGVDGQEIADIGVWLERVLRL